MDIIGLFNDNIGIILSDITRYISIIDRSTDLKEFDALNRMLIELQSKGKVVSNLKTEQQWKLVNRRVVKGSKPINVLIPVKKISYIDRETGDIADISELSAIELKQALDYKILQKNISIESFQTVQVYDIKNTYKLKSDKDESDKKAYIGIENALKLLRETTGATILNGDNTYYNIRDNTISICNDHCANLYTIISNYLAKYYMEIRLSDYTDKADEYRTFSNINNLLQLSLQYAIESLIRGKSEINISSDIYNSIDLDRKIEVIYIIDGAINNLYEIMQSIGLSIPEFKAESIYRSMKAEKLSNILRANSINRLCRGLKDND